MSLDDFELYKFEFSENFSGFRNSQISDATTANRMKIHQYCQRQRCRLSTSNWSNFWHAFASRWFVRDSWASLYIIIIKGISSLVHALYVDRGVVNNVSVQV